MSDSSDSSSGSQESENSLKFHRDLHLQYLNWMLQELPGAYQGEESSRLTLAYFVISALDVLGALDHVAVEDTISWVYGLQVLPLSVDDSCRSALHSDETTFGFRGSSSVGISFSPYGAHPIPHDGGHLAMTYSALAILTILGDDFSRVSREAILSSLRRLQQPDGSFSPAHVDNQADLRFVFCATFCVKPFHLQEGWQADISHHSTSFLIELPKLADSAAISVMLDDWNGMDRKRVVNFIIRSQSYDGGFSLSPGLESHGGATYCAVSALRLITQFDPSWPSSVPLASIIDLPRVVSWCLQRQVDCGGFQGRANKPADTCYAFWLGGSLRMLGLDQLCDQGALHTFLLSCQSKWGGFTKFPKEGYPDLLHSYYGLCGFSLLGKSGLHSLVFGLGLTYRSASRLAALKRRDIDVDNFDSVIKITD